MIIVGRRDGSFPGKVSRVERCIKSDLRREMSYTSQYKKKRQRCFTNDTGGDDYTAEYTALVDCNIR